jgi:hypothetical protein
MKPSIQIRPPENRSDSERLARIEALVVEIAKVLQIDPEGNSEREFLRAIEKAQSKVGGRYNTRALAEFKRRGGKIPTGG